MGDTANDPHDDSAPQHGPAPVQEEMISNDAEPNSEQPGSTHDHDAPSSSLSSSSKDDHTNQPSNAAKPSENEKRERETATMMPTDNAKMEHAPNRRVSARSNKGVKKIVDIKEDTPSRRTTPRRYRASSSASISQDKSSSPEIPAGLTIGDEFLCTNCFVTESPQWRHGPMGPKTLCNACGLRHSKGTIKLNARGRSTSMSVPRKPTTPPESTPQLAEQPEESDLKDKKPKTVKHATEKQEEEEEEAPHADSKSDNDNSMTPSGVTGTPFEKITQKAIMVGPGTDTIEPLHPVTPDMKRMEFKKRRKVCTSCGVHSTPCWRKGPLGFTSLCNACGLKFKSANLILNPYTGAPFDKTPDQIFVRPSNREFDPSAKRRSKMPEKPQKSTRPQKPTSNQDLEIVGQQQQQQVSQISPSPMLADNMKFGVSFTKQKRKRKKTKVFDYSSSDDGGDDTPVRRTPTRPSSSLSSSSSPTADAEQSIYISDQDEQSTSRITYDFESDDHRSMRTYARKRRSLNKGVSTIVRREIPQSFDSHATSSSLRQTEPYQLLSSHSPSPQRDHHGREETSMQPQHHTPSQPLKTYTRISEMEVDQEGYVSEGNDRDSTISTPGIHTTFESVRSSMKRRRGRPKGSRNRSREELERLARLPKRKRGRPPKFDRSDDYSDYRDCMIMGFDNRAGDDYPFDDEQNWYSDSSGDGVSRFMKRKRNTGNHITRKPQPKTSLVSRLPVSIFLHMFSFFDARTLSTSSLVCHAWRLVAFTPMFWKQLYEKKFTIDHASLAYYSGFIDWRQLYVARRHINLFSPIEQAEFMCKFYAVENDPRLLECITYKVEAEREERATSRVNEQEQAQDGYAVGTVNEMLRERA